MGNNSNPVMENEKEADDWNRPTALSEMMVMMLDHLDQTYGCVEIYLKQAGCHWRSRAV